MAEPITLYDTTLRDGTQGESVNLSAEDKLKIVRKLDDFGIPYIEGGWPGSNPKDARFFNIVRKIPLKQARMAAFGSTHKPKVPPDEDKNIRALLKAETEVVTIVGKSWDLHVSEVLNISLDKNLALIHDTILYLKGMDREVLFDAEHFFDGFKANPDYALKTLDAAQAAGADVLVLCDTNGGSMPDEIGNVVEQAGAGLSVPLGIHTHNDCGLALANALAAVKSGAALVQGTVNGYGERCGNADLVTVIGSLQLKMGYGCIPTESLGQLTELSRFVSEVANITPYNQRPFVGKSAFAHKGGVHVSAMLKHPSTYEHIQPGQVGNRQRVVVSDLAGKSNIAYKSREMGIELGGNGYDSENIVKEIKRLEDEGYQFDAAEGSLELLIRRVTGQFTDPFALQSFRVTTEKDGKKESTSQATIKIKVGEDNEITAAEGDGPVNALDNALRKALAKFYPQIREMGLVDFKVRVIDGNKATAAKVRVQIESRDKKEIWTTIGVSENVLEASWQALVDSVHYKLLKADYRKEKARWCWH